MKTDLIKRLFGLGTLIFLAAACGCEFGRGGVSLPEDAAPRAALRLPSGGSVIPQPPAETVPHERALEAAVEARLALDRRFYERGLTVRVNADTVVLEGAVSPGGDRASVRRVVADVPGVQRVDDRFVTELTDGAAGHAPVRTDAALQSDVQRALTLSRRVSGAALHVRVSRSVAALSGIVASDSERIAAGEIALHVPGVWSVKNGLIVQPQ